jgi:hypothetical protein
MFKFIIWVLVGVVLVLFLEDRNHKKNEELYEQAFSVGFETGKKHALTEIEQENRCLELWGGQTQKQQHQKGML